MNNFESVPWPNHGSGWSIDKNNYFYVGDNPNLNSFGFEIANSSILYFEWMTDFSDDEWGLFTFIEPNGIKHYCRSNGWDQVKFPVGPGEVKWVVEKAPNNGRGFIKNLYIQHFGKDFKEIINNSSFRSISNNSQEDDITGTQNQSHLSQAKYGPGYICVNASSHNMKYIYETPQEAIDVVQDYGIVEIQEGNYSQHIVVKKPIIIRGLNKDRTNIFGSLGKDTISVIYSNVTIENLTIYGGEYGICIKSSNDSIIINNSIINSNDSGICLQYSNNCNVTKNFVNNCSKYGIIVDKSDNNSINNNQLDTCRSSGLFVRSAKGNDFISNVFYHINCLFLCLNAASNNYTSNITTNNNFRLQDCNKTTSEGVYICKKYLNSSCSW